MEDRNNIELIDRARQGDRESLDRLAELARVRLTQYVRRIMLEPDLTDDIVQESILEMFKVFDKLKRTDRFWGWLQGIALNRIRRHYGSNWKKRKVSLAEVDGELMKGKGSDALSEMVTEEIKHIVAKSIGRLEPRDRAILTMRCYESMKYREIAEMLGSSQLSVRMGFCRAKRALAGELARHGLSKGSLLMALTLFGKMTASSEAAAATVSVSAGALQVGSAATIATAALTKTAIVTITAAGIVIGTAAVVGPGNTETVSTTVKPAKAVEAAADIALVAGSVQEAIAGSRQLLYYYPDGPEGAVMTELKIYDPQKPDRLLCRILENEKGTFHSDGRGSTRNSYHTWNGDLSVKLLPTDLPELRNFIAQTTGIADRRMPHVPDGGRGLLVVTELGANGHKDDVQVAYHQNMLYENYFESEGTDSRDAMHKRGWTYLRIEGRVGDRAVDGVGRLPFVYAASKRYTPWLRVAIAGRELTDAGSGRLFAGLSRPWMGLHTIDTVRRDAARRR
ncbi:MAG: sigma-70 family RNA polymerase sigma factor, partial [Planctomycetes bacterium]|nr:sigma-70 family RNA polymerase sigma factor [Planctomycetota bacterium]